MRLRLRDGTTVLALGGAVTGVRIYCAFVADRDGDRLSETVELVPFTAVSDIVSHGDADVAAASDAYRRLWNANPIIREIGSAHWDAHRTFDRGG